MYVYENELEGSRVPVHRKFVGAAAGGGTKVYVDYVARPFCELTAGDFLDTADLCTVFGVSQRTAYRWMRGHGLRPALKVGREFLFTKGEIVRWFRENRPTPGRPPGTRRG